MEWFDVVSRVIWDNLKKQVKSIIIGGIKL